MRKLFLTFAVLLFMAVIAAPPLMAAGTLAGTAISNQAYGEYKDANSNVMPKVYSNTVTITVYQVYGVNVDPATIASTAKNGDVIYFHVQPFNTGNGNDTQTYTYVPSGDWTPSVQFFYDVNNNHTYDAGDILLTQTSPNTYKSVNGVGAPVLISPDDDYDIMMQVTVPGSGTAADGSKSIITVTATSDRSVGTPGGTKTSTGIYTTNVLAAAIAAVKTHTPAGTPTYLKPGDVVTYTVTLTNSGGTAGTSAGVTDPLPANVTYVPGSLKVSIDGGPFVAKTDGADSDGVKYDAGTKSVIAPDGGTLTISDKNTAGHIWAVQFQATLNAGTSMGSAVVNQADITYTSGTSPPVTIKTNGDTCLVSQLAGIDLTTTATPKTGDPGDQIIYPFTAVNNGNNPDTINFTTPPTSTQGWTWAIWADTNGDGIPDYLLTDTNGDGKKDTGVLPQNGTINLLAVATIPAGTANGTTDTVTISGFSVFDPTKTDTLSFTTTVRAPILSMVKELVFVKVPSGSGLTDCTPTNKQTGAGCENTYVPGSILTYQVTATNSGNGNATVVVLTDLIPTHTTYKTGTIRTGSSVGTLTARTDATDGDGAEFNTGANAIVVPDGGTLTIGPTGTSVFEFQVTIN